MKGRKFVKIINQILIYEGVSKTIFLMDLRPRAPAGKANKKFNPCYLCLPNKLILSISTLPG
jgi:hypothetical protein